MTRYRLLPPALPSALIAAGLLLAALGAVLAFRYAHPLYYWDHAAYVDAYIDWRVGETGLWDFLHRNHNEHRLALTKLVLIADLTLDHGRSRLVIAAMLALFFATGAGLAWVAARREAAPTRVGAALLGGAAMVGTATLGNTAWPTQIQFAFAYAVPFALFAAAMRIRDPGRLAVCALPLALLSAETMANGILAPFVAAVAVLVFRGDRKAAAILVGAGTAGLALYLWPSAIEHAATTDRGFGADNAAFFLAAIANPFQWVGMPATLIAGGLLLLLSAATAFALLRALLRANARPLDPDSALLLAMAAYAGLSIAALAVSRGTGADPSVALTSRYATPAIVLMLSLSGLLYRVPPIRIARGVGAALFAATVASTVYSPRALHDADALNDLLDRASAAISVAEVDRETLRFYGHVCPCSLDHKRRMIAYLKEHRLGLFAP